MSEVNPQGTSLEDVAARLVERSEQEATPEVTQEAAEAIAPVETVEVEDTETEVEAEADTEEAKDEPEQVEEETGFQTIYELAEALEIEPDDFLANIQAKVKVNGQESEVTLAEALKGYQLEADYRRKTTEVAEERREVEQAREAIESQNQQWQQRMSDADATVTIATNALMAEYNSIDWDKLKSEDPTQFLVRQQEYQGRMGQLTQAKETLMAKAQEMQQAQLSELLPKESAALKRAIPEWESEDTMKAEQAAVFEYLSGSGYKPEELNNLYDHRAVVIARKAMLYDKATSKQPTDKKVVKKVIKKNLKGGVRKPATTIKQDALKKARTRLRKSGSATDAAALLLQKMG